MATTNKNFKVKNGLEVAGEIGVGSTPSYGTTGQILSSQGAGNAAAWIDVAPAASYTSVVKHDVRLAEAITKGQAVYVSSSNGSNIVVSKASNASEATSSKTLGLLESSGSTNNQRNVVTEGLLSGIDVGAAAAGDPVWLGTSGNLIYGLTNKPIAPAHLVFIGIVTRTGNNGEIFVRPQNGFELNELHTVLIGTDYTANSIPGDNEFLAYNLATNLWINQTAEEAGVANLSGATFTGNVAGTNISLSGNVNATIVNATTFTGTAAFANTAFSVAISNVSSMGTNVSTFLTTPNSLNLLNTITDETGTGNVVFSTSPVLTTPNIGAAIGTSLNVTGQLISTVATGTAPLSVSSTTIVANLAATSATNAAALLIADDTSTATAQYVTWTGSTSENTAQKITSTKLTFVPSTGILSATQFSGSGAGLTSIPNGATTASSSNGASLIVTRDASGNFTANTINATTLIGNTNAATITGTVADGTTTTAASGVGYMGMPQNIMSANTVSSASHAGEHIYITTSGTAYTIASNANVAVPIGTTIVVIAGYSSGTSTINIQSTDTLRLSVVGSTGSRNLAAYGMATLVKVAATTWFISGNGLT